MFCITFLFTIVPVVKPVFKLIPVNDKEPFIVHGVPAANGAVPPIQLLAITLSLVVVLALIKIGFKVAVEVNIGP